MMISLIICDQGKHARSDDVVHILMVKFETYQTQMGARISDYMFHTYKIGRPKNCFMQQAFDKMLMLL
jgi:hypothetical protein